MWHSKVSLIHSRKVTSISPPWRWSWRITQNRKVSTGMPVWWGGYSGKPTCFGYKVKIQHGLTNVLVEHHPNVGGIISNKYIESDVQNPQAMGHLANPVCLHMIWTWWIPHMNLAIFIPSEHEEIAGITMVYIPSGKLLHNYGKSHVEWETHLFLCPFSVAMLNIVQFTRG